MSILHGSVRAPTEIEGQRTKSVYSYQIPAIDGIYGMAGAVCIFAVMLIILGFRFSFYIFGSK